MASKKIKSKGGSSKRQTPFTFQKELKEKLNEHRKKIAETRLSVDHYRNPKFLKLHKNRYDFYIFDLNREISRNSGTTYLSHFKDIYRTKDLGRVEFLFNELTLYGHLVFYDFKPYPDNKLKKMITHINGIQKNLFKIKEIILDHSKMPMNVKERHRLGLGSAMPVGFPLLTVDELDVIEWEMILLRDICEADKKVPTNTKTNFKAKMQYFFYLCDQIFACIDTDKYPMSADDKSPNYWEKIRKEFYIRMAEEMHSLSKTEKGQLLDATYLRPNEKKYEIKKFHDLMGVRTVKDFDKARKNINF